MNDDNELPEDYEPCDECGYDHAYEEDEAYLAHLEKDGRQKGIGILYEVI